jgi:hypothetical protein
VGDYRRRKEDRSERDGENHGDGNRPKEAAPANLLPVAMGPAHSQQARLEQKATRSVRSFLWLAQ